MLKSVLCRHHRIVNWSNRIPNIRKYSIYDRVWSAGISQFGNLSFFEDGFGTPAQLRFFKNKIELIKSLNIETYVQQCMNTIKLDHRRIDGDYILVEGSL